MSILNRMLTTYSGEEVRIKWSRIIWSEKTYLANTICASAEPLGRNGEVIYSSA